MCGSCASAGSPGVHVPDRAVALLRLAEDRPPTPDATLTPESRSEVGITVRVPPDLRKEFKLCVLQNGETMQGLIERWITKYVYMHNPPMKDGDKP